MVILFVLSIFYEFFSIANRNCETDFKKLYALDLLLDSALSLNESSVVSWQQKKHKSYKDAFLNWKCFCFADDDYHKVIGLNTNNNMEPYSRANRILQLALGQSEETINRRTSDSIKPSKQSQSWQSKPKFSHSRTFNWVFQQKPHFSDKASNSCCSSSQVPVDEDVGPSVSCHVRNILIYLLWSLKFV